MLSLVCVIPSDFPFPVHFKNYKLFKMRRHKGQYSGTYSEVSNLESKLSCEVSTGTRRGQPTEMHYVHLKTETTCIRWTTVSEYKLFQYWERMGEGIGKHNNIILFLNF
jgi:hypothetical protein